MTDRGQSVGRDGVNIGGDNTGNITVGITFEQHMAALSGQDSRIRAELEEKYAERDRATAAEREKLEMEIAFLRQQVVEYAQRLASPEESYSELTARIGELERLLSDMSHGVPEARLTAARAALAQGRFDDALEVFREVKARAKEHAAEAAYGEGLIAVQQVRWADAAEAFAEAATLSPTLMRLLNACEYQRLAGRVREALPFGKDAVALAKHDHGPESAQYIAALQTHAAGLMAAGIGDEAEPLLREAVEIGARALGEQHPQYVPGLDRLATLLSEKGESCEARNQRPEAESLYREAEQMYRKVLALAPRQTAADQSSYSSYLNNIGRFLYKRKRYGKAERYLRKSIAMTERIEGRNHPEYAIRLNNLAGVLRDTDRRPEAAKLLREATDITGRTLGVHHPTYAIRLNNLAQLLGIMGKPDEARPLFRDAVAVARKALGPDHRTTRQFADDFARFLILRGTVADFQQLTELRAAFGPDIGSGAAAA